MRYPNEDDLLSPEDFEAAFRRVIDEDAKVREARSKLTHSEDRALADERLAELEQRRRQLNASQGRRTVFASTGRWPQPE